MGGEMTISRLICGKCLLIELIRTLTSYKQGYKVYSIARRAANASGIRSSVTFP